MFRPIGGTGDGGDEYNSVSNFEGTMVGGKILGQKLAEVSWCIEGLLVASRRCDDRLMLRSSAWRDAFSRGKHPC